MKALADIADRLVAAEWPVLLPEYVGRVASGFTDMVALADTVGRGGFGCAIALNFPTEHPLDCRMNKESSNTPIWCLRSIAAIGNSPPSQQHEPSVDSAVAPNPIIVDIGFADIEISKWAMGYPNSRARRACWPIRSWHSGADPLCQERVAKDPAAKASPSANALSVNARQEPGQMAAGFAGGLGPSPSPSRALRWKCGSRSNRKIGCSPPTL